MRRCSDYNVERCDQSMEPNSLRGNGVYLHAGRTQTAVRVLLFANAPSRTIDSQDWHRFSRVGKGRFMLGHEADCELAGRNRAPVSGHSDQLKGLRGQESVSGART